MNLTNKEYNMDTQRLNKDSMFYKSIDGNPEIKEREEGALPIITVKFASFGNLDRNGDIMVQGSFADSQAALAEGRADVPFLLQHESKDVAGRVLSIWEDQGGAYAEVELSDPDLFPEVAKMLWQLEHKHLSKFSFGFKYDWEKCKWAEDGSDSFIVGGVELFEVSVVAVPANVDTSYLGSKEIKEHTIARPPKAEPTECPFKKLAQIYHKF